MQKQKISPTEPPTREKNHTENQNMRCGKTSKISRNSDQYCQAEPQSYKYIYGETGNIIDNNIVYGDLMFKHRHTNSTQLLVLKLMYNTISNILILSQEA